MTKISSVQLAKKIVEDNPKTFADPGRATILIAQAMVNYHKALFEWAMANEPMNVFRNPLQDAATKMNDEDLNNAKNGSYSENAKKLMCEVLGYKI